MRQCKNKFTTGCLIQVLGQHFMKICHFVAIMHVPHRKTAIKEYIFNDEKILAV